MDDDSEQSSEIRDPKALRALAHPLRWRLIDVLGTEGQATATRCAAVLRESVASCSYHLNTLAKYGFVEVSPGGQGREKPWRLTDMRQSWAADADSVEGGLAADLVSETFIKVELERLIQWQRRRKIEPEPWRKATVTSGVTSFLTADELRELSGALNDLASRYVDRLEDRSLVPSDARPVRIFIATTVAEASA
jgi:predicted ArsR family transcriptional regulator